MLHSNQKVQIKALRYKKAKKKFGTAMLLFNPLYDSKYLS